MRLANRVNRLEAVVGVDMKTDYSDLPYSFEKDWTEEEISIVADAIILDEDPPEELAKKLKLTRPSGCTAGMTEEEIGQAVEEIKQKRRSYYEEGNKGPL